MKTSTQYLPDIRHTGSESKFLTLEHVNGLTVDAAPEHLHVPNAATLACREKRTGQTEFRPTTLTRQPKESQAPPFPPLEQVTRPTVPTEQAGYYLNRRPQTMRAWAMKDGTGPVRALRIHGRLAWPVAELKRVLGVA